LLTDDAAPEKRLREVPLRKNKATRTATRQKPMSNQ
jgi:hypothetical protein